LVFLSKVRSYTAASIEERELALEAGEVDENGIPMCTVVADGQWCKRSYKTMYNALSGVVRISTFCQMFSFKY